MSGRPLLRENFVLDFGQAQRSYSSARKGALLVQYYHAVLAGDISFHEALR